MLSGAPTLVVLPIAMEAPSADMKLDSVPCERAVEQGVVRVKSLSGGLLAEIGPPLVSVAELRTQLSVLCGTPPRLQKLVRGMQILSDGDVLESDVDGVLEVTFILDESPLFSWDIAGNPERELLSGSGCDVRFEDERVDYVNVITQEPLRSGIHFFEFVMHTIGDEQWCGLTSDRNRAGYCGSNRGWFYYSGRRSSSGRGALHAPQERKDVVAAARVSSGDTIGLLVDMQRGAAVFALNGSVQGAVDLFSEQRLQQGASAEPSPLYLTTSFDRAGDRVELRKVPFVDIPDVLTEALQGPLLRIENEPRSGCSSRLRGHVGAPLQAPVSLSDSEASAEDDELEDAIAAEDDGL